MAPPTDPFDQALYDLPSLGERASMVGLRPSATADQVELREQLARADRTTQDFAEAIIELVEEGDLLDLISLSEGEDDVYSKLEALYNLARSIS